MPKKDTVAAVEYWLRRDFPGGLWVLPHWQEGPFHLVPVGEFEGRARRGGAKKLLAASALVCADLPMYDGDTYSAVDVYAVSDFVLHYLTRYGADDGAPDAHSLGPYDALPGASDLVQWLPELMALDSQYAGAAVEKALADLKVADPAEVLMALATFDPAALVGVRPPDALSETTPAVDYLAAALGAIAK